MPHRCGVIGESPFWNISMEISRYGKYINQMGRILVCCSLTKESIVADSSVVALLLSLAS